jgi:hypothetical protein
MINGRLYHYLSIKNLMIQKKWRELLVEEVELNLSKIIMEKHAGHLEFG